MLLKNVRLSFPNLFTASSFSPDQKKKFSATFLFPKGSPLEKEVRAELLRVAEEKWGAKGKDTLKGLAANGKVALQDGATKAEYDGFGDERVYVNASTDKRPAVLDRDKTPLSEEDSRIYPGCWVNAVVEFWAQDNQFGRRINAQLKGVQFVRDDEPLGGGGKPASADDFPDLEEETATAGEDDIPW